MRPPRPEQYHGLCGRADRWTPTPLHTLPPARGICGRGSLAFVVDLDGRVWSWGRQADPETEETVGTLPTLMEALEGIEVASVCTGTLARDSAGGWVDSGHNSTGRYGIGDTWTPQAIPEFATLLP